MANVFIMYPLHQRHVSGRFLCVAALRFSAYRENLDSACLCLCPERALFLSLGTQMYIRPQGPLHSSTFQIAIGFIVHAGQNNKSLKHIYFNHGGGSSAWKRHVSSMFICFALGGESGGFSHLVVLRKKNTTLFQTPLNSNSKVHD